MKRLLLIGLFGALVSPLRADVAWMLSNSTLTYHVDHPLHHISGASNATRGKGACGSSGCDFLIGVPVSTFKSGDDNRDLHMIQAVNGATNPLIAVRTHLKSEPAPPGLKADLDVDFGGKQATYNDVVFDVSRGADGEIVAKGTLPLLLSRHGVKRPALLGVPIKDAAPVTIEITWKRSR